jgi:hypothetical protein
LGISALELVALHSRVARDLKCLTLRSRGFDREVAATLSVLRQFLMYPAFSSWA